MRNAIRGPSLLFLGLAAACSDTDSNTGPEVDAIVDISVDFNSFQTFDVLTPVADDPDNPRPGGITPTNEAALIQSIVDEMMERGYTRDTVAPQLTLTASVRIDPVVFETEYCWWDYYWGWYSGYGDCINTGIVEADLGTLLIDSLVVTGAGGIEDDVLIFRGFASGAIPDNPAEVTDDIPGIVDEIFSNWPKPEV